MKQRLRKSWKRGLAIALSIAIALGASNLSGSVLTSDAAGSDSVPVFTHAEHGMEFILSEVQKEETRLLIPTKASGNPLTLEVTFPCTGGIRICDSDGEYQGEFQPEEVEKITYTDDGAGHLTAEANGERLVLNYSQADGKNQFWTLSAYAGDAEVWSVTSGDIKAHYENVDGSNVRKAAGIYGTIEPEETFLGLGERYTGAVLNGETYDLWNMDMGPGKAGTASYVNVPFLHSSKGYSLFFSSYYGGTADIGETDPGAYKLDFCGPTLDFYIFTGTPLDNIQSYTVLTGRPTSVPEWALGYWIGGMTGYWKGNTAPDPDAAMANDHYYYELLEDVLSRYQALGMMPTAVFGEGLPSQREDAIKLARDYNVKMLGWNHPDIWWRGGSTESGWNGTLTEGLLWNASEWNDDGSLNTNLPLIRNLEGTAFYADENGLRKIDYTHPSAVLVAKEKMQTGNGKQTYWDLGIRGAMVDYGEWVAGDTSVYNGMTGYEMHNYQAYAYNQVVRQAWEEALGDDFVLFARAGSAGSQQFAAQFGGDQQATFDGLKEAVLGGVSISNSGFSVWGSDIGGLQAPTWNALPSDELYMRWLGFAAFSPLMRSHGITERNPWAYGETAQEAFENYYWLRQNLLPALYSTNLQTELDGTPMMQSMAVAFPEEKQLFAVEDQYMFCNEILVAPVYTEGASVREVTLPEGTWYDLYTGERITSEGTAQSVEAPADTTPAFLRSGTVLPVQLDTQSLALTEAIDGYDASDAGSHEANALLVTPAEGTRSQIWYTDEAKLGLTDSAVISKVTYTSQRGEDSYTITSDSRENPTFLTAYATRAGKVFVDGRELARLEQKPEAGQEGRYVDLDANRTIVSCADGDWSRVTFQLAGQASVYDCEFALVNENQWVGFLDDLFEVYKYNKPDSEEDVEAAVGPVKPSDEDPDSADGHSYFTTAYLGTYGQNYLKPSHVFEDGYNMLTYKEEMDSDFYAEYEMLGTYSIYGIAVGGEKGVFPVSLDGQSDNDSGVLIAMENDGKVHIAGAINPQDVVTTGAQGVSVNSQYNKWTGAASVYTRDSLTGRDIDPAKSGNNKSDSYTVCVSVENGRLTVWEKESPDAYISVALAEQYRPGQVSLLTNQVLHGAFKAFRLRMEDGLYYDFKNLAALEALDGKLDSYEVDKNTGAAVPGTVSEQWGLADGTVSGADYAGGGILPDHTQGNASTISLLTVPGRRIMNFTAEFAYIPNYTQYGLIVGEEGTLPEVSGEGIQLFYSSEGKLYVWGAINSQTASYTGTGAVITKVSTGYVECGPVPGMSNADVNSRSYTVRVSVSGRQLTVWIEEYPDYVFSVALSGDYAGGALSLYSTGCNQGAFQSLRLKAAHSTWHDLRDVQDLAELDENWNSYYFDTVQEEPERGNPSEQWIAQNGGIAPVHRNDGGIHRSLLTMKDKEAESFHASFAYAANYTGYGLIVGEEGTLPETTGKGIQLYYTSDGRLQVRGAVDPDSAECGDAGITTRGENFIETESLFPDGVPEGKIYTVDASVQDGRLIVWNSGAPEHVFTAELTEEYEGGALSLYSYGNNQGAFLSWSLEETQPEGEVSVERILAGDIVTFLLKTAGSYDSLTAAIEYDAEQYEPTDPSAFVACGEGVAETVSSMGDRLSVRLTGQDGPHDGQWALVSFRYKGVGTPQTEDVVFRFRGRDASSYDRDLAAEVTTPGDADGDGLADVRDLIRVKRYAAGAADDSQIQRENCRFDGSIRSELNLKGFRSFLVTKPLLGDD